MIDPGRLDLPDHLLTPEARYERMSPSQREVVRAEADAARLWYGTCQVCGVQRRGLLVDLQKPGCVRCKGGGEDRE